MTDTKTPILADAHAAMAEAHRLTAAGATPREVHAQLFAVAEAQERAGFPDYANRMRSEANKLVPLFALTDRKVKPRRWWRR